jgi:tetratricopeptide (TPR) repeat protein
VQAESVAWITELKNTQSCLFYLLVILFFLKWRQAAASVSLKGGGWYYTLALLCAMLAMLSKTSTVMLPVVLGLCWWRTADRWRWRNVLSLVPFFLISTVAGLWTIWEQKFHSGAVGTAWSQTWPERIAIAGKIVWFYLGKLIWPHPLIFIYPRWEVGVLGMTAYLPVLLVAVSLAGLWLYRRRTQPVFFAFAYFVVSLFPVLGFFNIYFFRYSFVGDHFQYLASIGPLALAAAAITTALGSFKERTLFLKPAFCGMLLVALGTLTWQQCGMYASVESLWKTTLRLNPGCWMAQFNLGGSLMGKGKADQAVVYFQKALQLNSDDVETRNDLGAALLEMGKRDEAISHFQKALQLKPDYAEARNNLGAALLQKGKVDEAIIQFLQALQLKPDYAQAHNNLGLALGRKGKVDEAGAHFQLALQISPDYAEAHYNLGGILLRKGSLDEAITHFQRALEIKADNADAQFSLGDALQQKGKVDEAITHLQEALQIRPDDAEAHYTLGNALLQKGKVDEAITHLQKALEINPGYAEAHNNLGNAFSLKGDLSETIIHYQQALQIEPANPGFLNNLAWLLATCPQELLRNGGKAVELARKANDLTGGNNPLILHTLAAACAEAGRFPEAVDTAQRALQTTGAHSNSKLARQLQLELTLYQAGTPFHTHARPH